MNLGAPGDDQSGSRSLAEDDGSRFDGQRVALGHEDRHALQKVGVAVGPGGVLSDVPGDRYDLLDDGELREGPPKEPSARHIANVQNELVRADQFGRSGERGVDQSAAAEQVEVLDPGNGIGGDVVARIAAQVGDHVGFQDAVPSVEIADFTGLNVLQIQEEGLSRQMTVRLHVHQQVDLLAGKVGHPVGPEVDGRLRPAGQVGQDAESRQFVRQGDGFPFSQGLKDQESGQWKDEVDKSLGHFSSFCVDWSGVSSPRERIIRRETNR